MVDIRDVTGGEKTLQGQESLNDSADGVFVQNAVVQRCNDWTPPYGQWKYWNKSARIKFTHHVHKFTNYWSIRGRILLGGDPALLPSVINTGAPGIITFENTLLTLRPLQMAFA